MPIPLAAAARGIKKYRKYRKLKRARAAARGRRRAAGLPDKRPYILSPEGIAMMTVAVAFDFIPPIFVLTLNLLFGMGELISWPIDISATIILGGWMWMRGGEMTFGKKLMRFLKKRGLLIALEYVPLVGALPWWTINVFLFLRK